MKFNFKKVASVIASAVMITSTVGFAAAATYPAPFSSGNTAVVYGSSASVDAAAAISIQSDLNSKTTVVTGTTGTAVTATGGDNYQFSTGSNKLYFGTNLSDVKSRLTADHLPVLLKDGTYRNKKSNTYDFTQQINLGTGLQFTQFRDNDYTVDAPTVGILVNQDLPVLNYTVSFTSNPESIIGTTADSNVLADFKNTKITLLGKEYTIMDAQNNTDGVYLQLMAGSARDTINYNEEKTFTIGNKSYSVKCTFVGEGTAEFTINGETTDTINVGDTYKLGDGTQIGLNSVHYQNFAGGIMSADLSIGADKLELENGQVVQVNDKSNDDLKAVISSTISGSTLSMSKIIIEWTPTDKHFLTQGTDLTMPALGSIKFTMGNLTVPKIEKTKIIADGDKAMKIQTTVKDGDTSLDLLYGNGTIYQGIGKTATKLLTTSTGSTLTFDADNASDFVASWKSGSESESYVLKFGSFSTSDNTTSITNVVTGVSKDGLKVDSEVNFGNVALTITGMDAANKIANVSIGSNGNFSKLYTKDGLTVYLPYNSLTATGTGVINISAAPTTFNLVMKEQDKDGNVESGYPITTVVNWDAVNTRVQVASLSGNFTGENGAFTTSTTSNFAQTSDDSKIYVGYEGGALGTKVTVDKNPNQATAELEYHGGETFGNVFVASSGATITPGTTGTGGTVTITTDDKVADYQNKNLIVVGGSCINQIAAKILSNDTAPICGADFTLKTKVGPTQYIIETVASPYDSTKIAMLVAGYEAADTTNAAARVLQGVDTTVGSSQVYPIVAAAK
jgi:hypothetical protein